MYQSGTKPNLVPKSQIWFCTRLCLSKMFCVEFQSWPMSNKSCCRTSHAVEYAYSTAWLVRQHDLFDIGLAFKIHVVHGLKFMKHIWILISIFYETIYHSFSCSHMQCHDDFSWHYGNIKWLSWHLKLQSVECVFNSLFRLTTKKHQRFTLLYLSKGNPTIDCWILRTKGQ